MPIDALPPNHREGSYYGSDHLPYARIPALLFTPLHAAIDTPCDNPDRIDIPKLMRWIYAKGRLAADADKAPAVNPAIKLERCGDYTGRHGVGGSSAVVF